MTKKRKEIGLSSGVLLSWILGLGDFRAHATTRGRSQTAPSQQGSQTFDSFQVLRDTDNSVVLCHPQITNPMKNVSPWLALTESVGNTLK